MNKTETLKKNYEFKEIFSKGKYYKGNFLEVFVVQTKSSRNRIGIAVSTKAANSVNRNKIKRLIRESYRTLENEAITGYKLVILWKKNNDIEQATFYNIKNDLKEIFYKANMIKKEEKNEENIDQND